VLNSTSKTGVSMDRHDQFAGKNAASARAWEQDRIDKLKKQPVKFEPKIGKCDNCGKEKEIKAFRTSESNRGEGATSFGVVTHYYCEACKPQPKKAPELNKVQIKNMLKNAKKGLR
jgi:hypothetical protein